VIRQCVRAGNASLEAIGECTGAGTGCGGCHETIEDIVAMEQTRPLSEIPQAPIAPGLRRLPLVLSEVA